MGKLLVDRLEYLISCEQDTNEYDYDIAIICALENPEFKAIKDLSENWVNVKKKIIHHCLMKLLSLNKKN